MTKEEIRSELILEYERLIQDDKYKTKPAEGFDKVDAMSEHMQGSDAFYRVLIDKLNEVLLRNNMPLEDEQERLDFQAYISPTLKEYMGKYLRN